MKINLKINIDICIYKFSMNSYHFITCMNSNPLLINWSLNEWWGVLLISLTNAYTLNSQ